MVDRPLGFEAFLRDRHPVSEHAGIIDQPIQGVDAVCRRLCPDLCCQPATCSCMERSATQYSRALPDGRTAVHFGLGAALGGTPHPIRKAPCPARIARLPAQFRKWRPSKHKFCPSTRSTFHCS